VEHDRSVETGRRVVQINTDAGCDLEATMIDTALADLARAPRSLLFIENVGNLVCPALFDLGERAKIVVMAVTEGEDKPLKYPHVFRAASALVLTKADLVPHLGVDPARYAANARAVNPGLEVFTVSATRGHGVAPWLGWLRAQLAQLDDRRAEAR
jgi:hydrogenase nickel incorporation protein HypB